MEHFFNTFCKKGDYEIYLNLDKASKSDIKKLYNHLPTEAQVVRKCGDFGYGKFIDQAREVLSKVKERL